MRLLALNPKQPHFILSGGPSSLAPVNHLTSTLPELRSPCSTYKITTGDYQYSKGERWGPNMDLSQHSNPRCW